MSEPHWDKCCEFKSAEGNKIFLSGNDGHNGVAVIVSREYGDMVLRAKTVSDRIIAVRVDATPSPP